MQPLNAGAGSGRIRMAVLAIALLGSAGPACEPRPAVPDPMVAADSAIDTKLRDELIRLGMADQTARLGFDVTAADTGRLRLMLGIDSTLTHRLGRIVEERGWPGLSRVGGEAAAAAFLIVQHSPSDAFQRDMLPLIEVAAAGGEAAAADVAVLTDRVRTQEGKPQLYGTQFRIVGDALEPFPIEDSANLDARREQVGLLPMADYVKILETTWGGIVRFPPPDTLPALR